MPGGWRGRRGTGARNSSALQGRRGPGDVAQRLFERVGVQRRLLPALAARLRDRVEQQGEHRRIGRAPDGVVVVAVQLDAVVAGRERGDVERAAAVQLGDRIQRLGERRLREALGGRWSERVLQAHQQRHEPRRALDRGALEGGRLARPVDQHGVDAAAVAAARERGERRRPARELAVGEGRVRLQEGARGVLLAERVEARAQVLARGGADDGRREIALQQAVVQQRQQQLVGVVVAVIVAVASSVAAAARTSAHGTQRSAAARMAGSGSTSSASCTSSNGASG